MAGGEGERLRRDEGQRWLGMRVGDEGMRVDGGGAMRRVVGAGWGGMSGSVAQGQGRPRCGPKAVDDPAEREGGRKGEGGGWASRYTHLRRCGAVAAVAAVVAAAAVGGIIRSQCGGRLARNHHRYRLLQSWGTHAQSR